MVDKLFIAAKLMPEEKLLQELTKALENYKAFKTKESQDKLTMFMLLLISRYTSQKESVSETLNRFDEFQKDYKSFKDKKD